MKNFVTRASISTMFCFIWVSFSLSAFAASVFEEGFNAGLAACPTCQICQTQTCQICQICPPDRYNDGYNAGITSCPIMPDRYQEGYEIGGMEGRMRCQNNPAECGLHSPAEIDQAKYEAMMQCRNDPASCGIFTDMTDATQNAIKDYCAEDPSRCFDQLTTVPDYIDETYCDNKTKNCYSENGLYLSTVYSEYDTNTPFVKDVQMDILMGGQNLLFLLRKMEFVY
jgi:hypothetical protein